VTQSRNKSSKSRRRSNHPSSGNREATARQGSRRWSARVTRNSNALDLQPKIFRSTNARRIALSLKRSAEDSKRRKGTPYQSAMLNFYINRAGKNLSQKRRSTFWNALKANCATFSVANERKKNSVTRIGAWVVGGPWQFGWGEQSDRDSIAVILLS
jgi:hypothetical protein